MKALRNPKVHALLIAVVSAFYALLFMITSNHAEFIGLLSHPKTLQSVFWNGWSAFIQNGHMKYIGYGFIALTIAIVLPAVFKRRKYDEYQVSILAKGFMVAGVITVLMLPFALLLVLSDRGYAIETLFLLLTVQWLGVLSVALVYTVKHFR